jgi:lipoprotein-anchoring transpeptidase ErfK/SrfK
MNPNLPQAREHVVKAREALRRGDKDSARDLGEKAVLLVPELEDAWLILVAADPNPEDALAYAHKALELNPVSPRARKAVDWATRQLEQARAGNLPVMAEPVRYERSEAAVAPPIPLRKTESKAPARVEKKSNKRTWLFAAGTLGVLLCVALVFAGWTMFNNPAFASLLAFNDPASDQEAHWAQSDVAKPELTPIDVSAFALQAPSSTPIIITQAPTLTATDLPTLVPTETSIPTETPTSTPEPTETPGVMGMEILADTPTSVYVPPTARPPAAAASGGNANSGGTRGGVRWIDVNLSTQSLYAYEGNTVVNSFVVSTGTWRTPTVTGKFKIWIKLKSTTMSGPGYHLTNVPYTMYFYKGYGIHGTYWHNNFGTPMSHGCVNMRTSDAEWLFYWASEGTVVNVHY